MPMDWVPISDPRTLRILGKLIEELNEAGAAAARCVIQGLDGEVPDSDQTNREWLQDELADVIANVEITTAKLQLDTAVIRTRVSTKKTKLEEWLRL